MVFRVIKQATFPWPCSCCMSTKAQLNCERNGRILLYIRWPLLLPDWFLWDQACIFESIFIVFVNIRFPHSVMSTETWTSILQVTLCCVLALYRLTRLHLQSHALTVCIFFLFSKLSFASLLLLIRKMLNSSIFPQHAFFEKVHWWLDYWNMFRFIYDTAY